MTQGNWPPNPPRPGGPAPWGQQQWPNQAAQQWGQPNRQQWPQQQRSQQQWNQPAAWGQQPQWGQQPPQWGQQPWRPTPPPRRSSGVGGILFLIFSVLAVVVIAGVIFNSLAGDEPVEPVAPVQTTPPTEPADPPVEPPVDPPVPGDPPVGQPEGLPKRNWDELPGPTSNDPDWVTLQQNPLYTMPIPTIEGCPAPELAANLADLERLAKGQIDCLQAAYKPVLAALGLNTNDIPVYIYEGRRVDTPCGEVAAPALYCSAQGGAIYFGEDALNGASWVDFGTKDVAGHEYGHHLQASAGLFGAEHGVGSTNETARRAELQATCWGYASMTHDTSVEFSRSRYEEMEPFLRAVVEDGIHGSKDSNAYWGIRGLYSETFGNCNTWTANPADVD